MYMYVSMLVLLYTSNGIFTASHQTCGWLCTRVLPSFCCIAWHQPPMSRTACGKCVAMQAQVSAVSQLTPPVSVPDVVPLVVQQQALAHTISAISAVRLALVIRSPPATSLCALPAHTMMCILPNPTLLPAVRHLRIMHYASIHIHTSILWDWCAILQGALAGGVIVNVIQRTCKTKSVLVKCFPSVGCMLRPST
jgi:hypothetical protein